MLVVGSQSKKTSDFIYNLGGTREDTWEKVPPMSVENDNISKFRQCLPIYKTKKYENLTIVTRKGGTMVLADFNRNSNILPSW